MDSKKFLHWKSMLTKLNKSIIQFFEGKQIQLHQLIYKMESKN